MKLILLLLLSIITFSYEEKLERIYLPPNALSSGGSDGILEPPISRPIVVLDNDELQGQIHETVVHEDEIQRPNIIEDQRPILTTASPALQRPTSFAVSQNQFNVNNQEVDDVGRIGNRGNFFAQNQNSVDYKEVNYPGNVETVIHEDEIQRPNIIEDQRPVVNNLVTVNAALQRPTSFAVSQNQFNVNNQEVDDVVRIGNRGNFFAQNLNSVDYKEVNYPGNVETVIHEDEIQRPNIIEDQKNLVTVNAALQRPSGYTVSDNQFNVNQEVDDVVRIGNRGNFFAQNLNSVDYKEVNYPGPNQVVDQRQEHTQSSQERNVKILRQEYKNEGDTYAYAYETENGIWAEQNGVATNGVNAQGAYSYIGDDGVQYSMSYTADENGFQPKGDHIPTPHPIPEEILRSLEQNARDEAAGIFDDGSYDAQKYGGDDAGNQQRVNVVTSRPYVTPTFIQNRPTVPTIIDQHARNEDIVSIPNPLLLKYRTPGYRYTNIQLNEINNNLSPVVSALMQEVTPNAVISYLPPVKRKVSSENKPSKIVRKNEDRRKPEPKKNDQKE